MVSSKKCSCSQNVTIQRLTEFVCVWRGIIYFVSVVGGFDCPQYLIYICIAETLQCNANTTQRSAVQLLCWRHKSANPFVCWAKLSDDPCGVPFIPQSSTDVHISCQNWWKVGISGLPCKKTDTHIECVCVWEPGKLLGKDICIFFTKGKKSLR